MAKEALGLGHLPEQAAQKYSREPAMAETKLRATNFVKGDRWVYLRSNIKGITSHSLLRHEEKEFPFDRVNSWLTDDKRIVQVRTSAFFGAHKFWVIRVSDVWFGGTLLRRTFYLCFCVWSDGITYCVADVLFWDFRRFLC